MAGKLKNLISGKMVFVTVNVLEKGIRTMEVYGENDLNYFISSEDDDKSKHWIGKSRCFDSYEEAKKNAIDQKKLQITKMNRQIYRIKKIKF